MLNQTRVLDYIKSNLGFPFTKLELEDDKIIEYFTTYTLREFSEYIPQKKRCVINLTHEANQVTNRENEYYITDEQGLEILGVVDIYFDRGSFDFLGHPPLGPFSHGEIKQWALDTVKSMDLKMFSSYDYTFEFISPNIVRVSPNPADQMNYITVEYERIQPDDLSGIPNEFQVYFSKMALADIMILLGRIRKKYGGGNLRTPFGEIPLEAEVGDEGKELKREVLEKMAMGPNLNVVIDFG